MNEKDLARFTKKYKIDPVTGCWLWQGCVDAFGYGRMFVNHKNKTAHKLSYEHFVQPIMNDWCVLHKVSCPNRNCVNPNHLYLGTKGENVLDSYRTHTARPQGRAWGTFALKKGKLEQTHTAQNNEPVTQAVSESQQNESRLS